MRTIAALLACLPLLSGCMATEWLHNNPGIREKRVTAFRQAVQVDRTIMVEYDATVRNVSKGQNIGDVRHIASINLAKRQDDGRYPIDILEHPLSPSATTGSQIPIIPDHNERAAEFLASSNQAAIYTQHGNFYLMLKSDATPGTPEVVWYHESGGRYETWWRPFVTVPGYPAAIVFDVVTSPIQFVIIMNTLSNIGK